MTRPRGEVRQVLAEAVAQLSARQGAATFRQAAAVAQVGLQMTRHTLDNMVRSGQLQRVGYEKPAGRTHWHVLYAPPQPAEAAHTSPSSIDRLDRVMRGLSVGG